MNATTSLNGRRLVLGVLGIWTAFAFVASYYGWFSAIHRNFFAATVVAATAAFTLSYFRSRTVRQWAEEAGPYGMASFHVWRVGAAAVFFWYGWLGELPEVFVALAGGGDLLAGLFAAVVFVLPRNHRTISAFHVFGFADFLVAVGTGITLTQLGIPTMASITELPVALIPLVGVPLSGATHVASLHLLFARGRSPYTGAAVSHTS